MSTIKATTLSNLDGSKTVPTATVASGTAKAWVNFNGKSTVAIRASFNVSSITDNGTGTYTVNFTTAMSDANYSVAASGSVTANDTDAQHWMMSSTNLIASSVKIVTPQHGTTSATLGDWTVISVATFR